VVRVIAAQIISRVNAAEDNLFGEWRGGIYS